MELKAGMESSTGAMELNWRLDQRCPGQFGSVETGGVVTEVERMKLVGYPLESTPVQRRKGNESTGDGFWAKSVV
jgi:hypothetical protein